MKECKQHRFSIGGDGLCILCNRHFMVLATGTMRQTTIDEIMRKTERVKSIKAEIHHVKCLRDMIPEENVIDIASLDARISNLEEELQDEYRS